MSKFTHTTWTACKDGSIQIKDSNGHVLSIYRDITAPYELETYDLSTARLIAAAPEMYELLKSVANYKPDFIWDVVFRAKELLARIDEKEVAVNE